MSKKVLRDLELGKTAEKHLLNKLIENDFVASLNPERKNRDIMLGWDISFEVRLESCPSEVAPILIEVKFDKMAHKTGNLAIEYYNTKQCKNSGILATKAHLWAVVLENNKGDREVWIANTDVLTNHFKNVKCLREVVGGDDNSAMKLYTKESLLGSIFIRIDNLDKKQFRKAIFNVIKQRTTKSKS